MRARGDKGRKSGFSLEVGLFPVPCSLIPVVAERRQWRFLGRRRRRRSSCWPRSWKASTTAIIGTFAKLTVAKDFQLRKVIREAGGKYRVVKNKLAAVSGQGTQVEAALKGLKGVNSVAFTSGDPVALAKVFAKWAAEMRSSSSSWA